MHRERKYTKLFAALLIVVMALPFILAAPQAGAEDDSYWNRFKSLFIDWEDDAEVGDRHTEVTGVRGVDIEEKLGDKGYDWQAVNYMEDFKVGMEDEKEFMKKGGLGPFQK